MTKVLVDKQKPGPLAGGGATLILGRKLVYYGSLLVPSVMLIPTTDTDTNTDTDSDSDPHTSAILHKVPCQCGGGHWEQSAYTCPRRSVLR